MCQPVVVARRHRGLICSYLNLFMDYYIYMVYVSISCSSIKVNWCFYTKASSFKKHWLVHPNYMKKLFAQIFYFIFAGLKTFIYLFIIYLLQLFTYFNLILKGGLPIEIGMSFPRKTYVRRGKYTVKAQKYMLTIHWYTSIFTVKENTLDVWLPKILQMW